VGREQGGGYLARPSPSSLADVVEIILDKGLVLDAYVRVSLLGVELLTVDARFVVASVDTYLRFAEATLRLDLVDRAPPPLLEVVKQGAESMVENVASNVVEDKVEGALDGVGNVLGEPAKKVARKAGRKVVDAAAEVAARASDAAEGSGD
jgi:gas vesicle structural protein